METTTRAAACAPAPNRQFPSPTCRGCRLKTHAPAQLGKRRHQCAAPRAVCARAPTPASPLVLSLLAISFLPEADGRRGTWECGWNCASCTAPPHVTGRSLARQPPPLPSHRVPQSGSCTQAGSGKLQRPPSAGCLVPAEHEKGESFVARQVEKGVGSALLPRPDRDQRQRGEARGGR
jgi:hypothetical protein